MFAKEKLSCEALSLPDQHELSDAEMPQAALGFRDFMRERHTVRDYSDWPVPRGVIEDCIAAAGTAPSGANHQPWHFVAISNPAVKQKIRGAAEEEERRFYDDGASDEWLKALEPIGTRGGKAASGDRALADRGVRSALR